MKCRVAVFLIIGWGVLSLIGYLKKDGIYKNYSIDVKKTPYFVLVLDGIHDKIYPWSKELPDLLPDGTKPQNQESVIASTETTDEENAGDFIAAQTRTFRFLPLQYTPFCLIYYTVTSRNERIKNTA